MGIKSVTAANDVGTAQRDVAPGRDGAASAASGVIGIVVIGRNEGERLTRCLESLRGQDGVVVYVDSASTDGSADRAREMGVEVVVLDGSSRLSAARGRNEGFARLAQGAPTEFVQFVDGDCEIAPGWLERGAAALREDATLGVVCGRLREKWRERSVYARLCDMEWDGPVGEIRECGGVAMYRAAAFAGARGFNAAIRWGEEGELCGRLRKAGSRIVRIDAPMGVHDAGINSLGGWWRRAVHAGHAYALSAALPEDVRSEQKRRRVWSNVLWAAVMPMVGVAGLIGAAWWRWLGALPVLLMIVYAMQVFRVCLRTAREGRSAGDAWVYSVFCLLAKWPQVVGQIKYWRGR